MKTGVMVIQEWRFQSNPRELVRVVTIKDGVIESIRIAD
jgi:hypothetical protein